MSTELVTDFANALGISTGVAIFLLLIISVWTVIWKGLALWKSAKKNHIVWFIIFLIINTIGILEILYIYLFSEIGEKNLEKRALNLN